MKVNQCAAFSGKLLKHMRLDYGDIDADFVLDSALECGLLKTVHVSQPCNLTESGTCDCSEAGEFPQNCYRLTAAGRSAILAADDVTIRKV